MNNISSHTTKKIPSHLTVGGQFLNVISEEYVDELCGICSLPEGWIKIADKLTPTRIQSESSKVNTFYHELIHAILDTMGRTDLSQDETFVNCFAGFLTEAMKNAYFYED